MNVNICFSLKNFMILTENNVLLITMHTNINNKSEAYFYLQQFSLFQVKTLTHCYLRTEILLFEKYGCLQEIF